MPFNRLRRVLQHPLRVSVESTQDIADQVRAAAQFRPAHLNPKTPVPFSPLQGKQTIAIRAIDLLRKIGELTTPSTVNLSRLSASWATRRYFWAIEDPIYFGNKPAVFRLSQDARHIERHQKTLLSDEFGIGFAAVVMEQLLAAGSFVDMEFALKDPQEYFGVYRITKRTPDYLMWGQGTPIYIVECKGSQTKWSNVVGQLRRGMEQLPSIQVPGRPTEEVVVATYMQRKSTRVIILDPPGEDETELPETRKEIEVDPGTPEEISPKRFVARDPDLFSRKLRKGTSLNLLRWIAQHSTARRLESELTLKLFGAEWPNAELERVETPVGEFVGVSTPLAPELGLSGPQIFRGLERKRFEALDAGIYDDSYLDQMTSAVDDPRLSIGPLGSCLLIHNFDI
jgi:hypothetical protein